MDQPPEAWAAALATLPGMGPARLLALLRRWPPCEAWERVVDRSWLREPEVVCAVRHDPKTLAAAWVATASGIDVAALWQRYVDAGIGVAALGSPAYPAPLAHDIEPPA